MSPTAANPLVPLLGLPTYSATGEQLRLLGLLAEREAGLPFVALVAAGVDTVTTYGALFTLLTRGIVVAVDLGDGAVGYRRQVRRGAMGVAAAPLAKAA